MKIGILTFHSQLNYGGVLQCWALQTALEKLGHEVVVIDRWIDPDNRYLNRGFKSMSKSSRIMFAVRSMFRAGDSAWHLRVLRTRQFIEKYINRTYYHFYNWEDAPQELGVDCIVVGSDQVWHCGDFNDPRPYLLDGANIKNNIIIMSYAASFGMSGIPEYLGAGDGELALIHAEPVYHRGLSRFNAISCREQEGVNICQRLGFVARHVVDPTQLLTARDWTLLAESKRRRQLTCYLLGENVDAAIPLLLRFARRMNCRVKVLVPDSPHCEWRIPLPKSPRTVYRWIRGIVKRIVRWRVKIREDAGPVEFLKAHAECEWVITDSFHSLMFATIFAKNVRVLRPREACRQRMFARMEEFAVHASGPLLADDLSGALSSFERGESAAVDAEWVASCRDESIDYIRDNCHQ